MDVRVVGGTRHKRGTSVSHKRHTFNHDYTSTHTLIFPSYRNLSYFALREVCGGEVSDRGMIGLAGYVFMVYIGGYVVRTSGRSYIGRCSK